MKAGQTTLKPLIEGEKQYRIPLFQRPYTWSDRQLRQLWDDMLDQYEVLATADAQPQGKPARSTHFIGSFVLAPIVGQAHGVASYLVVDGQQRLTTLLLALAALREAQAQQDDRATEKYNQLYLRNEYATGLDRYKLMPTQLDREVFFSCIDGEATDDSSSRIATAYRFFTSQLAKGLPGEEGTPIDCERMRRVIVERLAIVEITTDPDDNPHRIFESLNATGVKLTQADLLRNYFFMLLPSRGDEVFQKVWLPMQEMLGNDNLEGLARVDLQRRGIDATKDDIYRLHQQRLEPISHDESKVEAEVTDLARRSRQYKRLIDPAPEPNPEIRAGLIRLNRWGAQTTYPLLMHVSDLVDREIAKPAEMVAVLSYIESFLVRRHLAQVPTSQLNRLFLDAIGQLPGDRPIPEGIRYVLSGERRYWPTDDQIRTAVRTKPFYFMGRAEQRKIILERIEESFGHKEPVDLIGAKLSIEHIMPQTLSQEWRDQIAGTGENPDQLRDELVHTLGNLTLTAYNGVLSNNPFQRKQQIYANSHLDLNKELELTAEWGRSQILQRADALAERIVHIWPSPVTGAKGAPIGFDWGRIDAAVAAIPAGSWCTYGDLAAIGGTSAQAVGNRLASNATLHNAYRVLDSQGRPSASFHWHDPSETRSIRDVLSEEGVLFDESGVASPAQRLGIAQLAKLIPYEFDDDELERLIAASEANGSNGQDEFLWLTDGKAWHLNHQASPAVRAAAEAVVSIVHEVAPNSEGPDWGQKHYVSWKLDGLIWLTFRPRQSWVWLQLKNTPFTAQQAASRLGFVFVPSDKSPSWKALGPCQVQAARNSVYVQLKGPADVEGPTGKVLKELLRETWEHLNGAISAATSPATAPDPR
jgi:alkylated DNA nucleotide flippase Atl1